ncbi:conserved hypothetical protein [Gammaproteobacteria bacterium]
MATDLALINHYVPLVAPVDKGNNTWSTGWLDLKDAENCMFVAQFGVLTATATTVTLTVTMTAASSAATTGGGTFAYNYRISAAVGTDTLGAVTAVAKTGMTLTTTSDAMTVFIDVPPSIVCATPTTGQGRYVRMTVTKSTTYQVQLASVMAILKPRHAGTTMVAAE